MKRLVQYESDLQAAMYKDDSDDSDQDNDEDTDEDAINDDASIPHSLSYEIY